MLKSSAEWYRESEEWVEIVDPDGWDRFGFRQSWDEPITKGEFVDRVMKSTIRPKHLLSFMSWSKEDQDGPAYP